MANKGEWKTYPNGCKKRVRLNESGTVLKYEIIYPNGHTEFGVRDLRPPPERSEDDARRLREQIEGSLRAKAEMDELDKRDAEDSATKQLNAIVDAHKKDA